MMPEPHHTEPGDEIGEANAEEIAAIIARFCPDCNPEEIRRRVHEMLFLRQPSDDTD